MTGSLTARVHFTPHSERGPEPESTHVRPASELNRTSHHSHKLVQYDLDLNNRLVVDRDKPLNSEFRINSCFQIGLGTWYLFPLGV